MTTTHLCPVGAVGAGRLRSRCRTAPGPRPRPGTGRRASDCAPPSRSASDRVGSTSTRGIQAAATSSSSAQVPMAIPARNAAPSVVASRTGATSTGRPQASARAWVKTGLAVIPPSTRRAPTARPESASAASSRSAPRWATPSSTARTSSGRPLPRVRPVNVPRAPKSQTGVPRPSSAGTNQTSPVVVARGGHGRRVGGVGDDLEVVAQPLHAGAGRQHDRLDAPGVDPVPTPGDDRDGAGRATDGLGRPVGAQALVEHAPGAERGLGLPGGRAALPDERGLLVAGHAGDGRGAVERGGGAEDAGRVDDGGKDRLGDAQGLEQRRAPAPSVAVDQAGHPGVRGVGDVQRTVGQDPGDPGVDGAEGQLPPLGPRPVRVGEVEDGGQLGGRGVGCDPDALALQLEAGADRAQVLPAEARPDRLARRPVPHQGGGPLVGDPDGRHRAAVGQAAGGHLGDGRGDGRAVELDESGERGVGQDGHVVDVLDGGVGAHDGPAYARGADVDDQDAHGQGTSP